MRAARSRGLRGSNLEELINITNREYLEDGLAVIQKVPTPITPVEIDNSRGVITLAYFDDKSTVDYIGNVQGIPVCFDAKETKGKSLPIANLHEHQIRFMEEYVSQEGVAFILVNFSDADEYYAMEIQKLKPLYEASLKGGRKSIPKSVFEGCIRIERAGKYLIHYLPAIKEILEK
ncbi:MAG: Holliday junction resolvase RecU [Eubacteriaceae bacterium]|nr:Holliday junction resolvase RecU [Eubacteriaceae bacterium]